MGITGRIMPLLSTLAALVIIVHSAEEDLNRGLDYDYRYDIRPRLLETRTPAYDEPWTSIQPEPRLQQSKHLNTREESLEEPRRRRPVRKRKRRPMIAPQENHSNEERYLNIETPVSEAFSEFGDDRPPKPRYHEDDEFVTQRTTQPNHQTTTEMTRKKRRKSDQRRNRWNEDKMEIERPIRRRGQRRQRPLRNAGIITRPVLAEFSDFNVDYSEHQQTYQQEEDTTFDSRFEEDNERDDSTVTEHGSKDDVAIKNHHNKDKMTFKDHSNKDNMTFKDHRNKDMTFKDIYDANQNSATPKNVAIGLEMFQFHDRESDFRDTTPKNLEFKEDRSLSEFSLELEPQDHNKHEDEVKKGVEEVQDALNYKISEKVHIQKSGLNQINRPIDPGTLKAILKRSNGTSLSEVLQQHNLSLSDLLRGKEDAISALKIEEFTKKDNEASNYKHNNKIQLTTEGNKETDKEHADTKIPKESDLELQSSGGESKIQSRRNTEVHDAAAINATRTRFPNMRRKLRMRTQPLNGTYKNPLSRDLMAQTARKYHNSRNITKSKEWKYIIPLMNSNQSSEELNKYDEATVTPSTTTSVPEESTILNNSEYYSPSTVSVDTETAINVKYYDDNDEMEKEIKTTTQILTTPPITTTELTTTTLRSIRLRPPASRIGLRRQSYNNRLKRKRMKQKNLTTEPPHHVDGSSLEIFGMPNLVSSSEFIARTQTPKSTNANQSEEDFTTLDDFMTTEKSKHLENGLRFTRNSTVPGIEIEPISHSTVLRFPSTTEETAKFEIEEILNDTRTSARLSRILMERNMTLNELVEHRERGSSHVHLADIFHNASKEPNPPEPFLSKSLIEPISRETYPLRAILEANSHDSGGKATNIDPNTSHLHSINIPVVMDFGNNVNENGENMGIMSLFNKIVGNEINDVENSSTGKDSEGTPYVTTIIAVNNTDINDTTREDKALKEQNNLNNDVVGWAELFELMRRSRQNESDHLELKDPSILKPSDPVLIEDADGDGVIVLGDLQRLKEFNINYSEEKVNINSYDKPHQQDTSTPGILDRLPSHTRSVTVATASIVGLAIILFLLTYAAFKWKQQRSTLRKKQSFSDGRIPTPVFESRKGHKNNCSTRSISPMLNTSNIYTLNTLDSSNGKDSPDYMWDSLRKPFQ